MPLREFGCLMVDVALDGWHTLVGYLPTQSLYQPDHPVYGRQNEPHVTILFGFHDAPGLGQELLDKLPVDLATLSQGVQVLQTGCFHAPEYDVLKMDVRSAELTRLNEWCRGNYPHTNTFPDYRPHVTLAYLQRGHGQRYAGVQLHKQLRISHITYSCPNGQKLSKTL